MDRYKDKWMDYNKGMNRWIYVDKWMNGWMDGWTDRYMYGWMDGQQIWWTDYFTFRTMGYTCGVPSSLLYTPIAKLTLGDLGSCLQLSDKPKMASFGAIDKCDHRDWLKRRSKQKLFRHKQTNRQSVHKTITHQHMQLQYSNNRLQTALKYTRSFREDRVIRSTHITKQYISDRSLDNTSQIGH